VNDLLLGDEDDEYEPGEDPAKILFMQSLEEEKKQAQILADDIRTAESDLDYVSKSALKLFKTKLDITDEQFAQIVELCRVSPIESRPFGIPSSENIIISTPRAPFFMNLLIKILFSDILLNSSKIVSYIFNPWYANVLILTYID
jgi:hypothetical protein